MPCLARAELRYSPQSFHMLEATASAVTDEVFWAYSSRGPGTDPSAWHSRCHESWAAMLGGPSMKEGQEFPKVFECGVHGQLEAGRSCLAVIFCELGSW